MIARARSIMTRVSLVLSRSCTKVAPPAASRRDKIDKVVATRPLRIDDRIEPEIDSRHVTLPRIRQCFAVKPVERVDDLDGEASGAVRASCRHLAGDRECHQRRRGGRERIAVYRERRRHQRSAGAAHGGDAAMSGSPLSTLTSRVPSVT